MGGTRGGHPAVVRSTQSKSATGIIRIEFPDAPNAKDDNLEEISWQEFFEKFDDAELALLYQEETASGQRSKLQQACRPRNGRNPRARRNARQPSSRQSLSPGRASLCLSYVGFLHSYVGLLH
jgi:hypothetical protein